MIIGKQVFNFYAISIILSIIIGLLYIAYSMKKDNYIYRKNLYFYYILSILSILIFGKMFTILTDQKSSFLTIGFSSYGGAIGIILSAIIYERIIPMNNKLIKNSIISLPLIYAIGKIGCFIAGCCHGIPYNGILSVTYTEGLNIPVFPIQITETFFFIIIFLILNKYRNNKYIIELTIISSALTKFLLDFLRYDHLTKIITVNQIFSIILILIAIIILIRKRNTKKELI